jgi:hypothetical protein
MTESAAKTGKARYVVVYEQTLNNWSAYVPDLPGCVAAGDTREEIEPAAEATGESRPSGLTAPSLRRGRRWFG